MLEKIDCRNVDFKKVDKINEMLYEWLHNIDFSKKEDERVLERIINYQDSDGFFKILTDFVYDKDYDSYSCLYPTYLCTAIWIKAINKNSRFLYGKEKELSKALEACTIRGLSNPTKYLEDKYIENLKIFAEANIGLFLSNYSYLSRSFTEMIIEHYNYYSFNASLNADAQYIISKLGIYYNVFVYGTLLKGEKNQLLLNDSEFVSKGFIKDYAIYDLGTYPGIKKVKGKIVKGEIYKVDLNTLNKLDILESNGRLYNRIEVDALTNELGKFKCFTYYYNGSVSDKKEIPYLLQPYSSCWNEEHIWYVSYGSNLCKDRFMCYLTGEGLDKYGLSKNINRKCSNVTPPKQEITIEIPYKLYFGGSSIIWNNKGTAYLDCNKKGKTIGKAYLITKDQYEHVKRYEGRNYQYEIRLSPIMNFKAVTFTSATTKELNVPDELYKKVLIDGLLECHLTCTEATEYLDENIR